MALVFTVECDDYYGIPTFDAYIGVPKSGLTMEQNSARLVKTTKLRCNFDTGSNSSAVSHKLVKSLNLKPFGTPDILHTPNAVTKTDIYKIDICLPNNFIITDHTVGCVSAMPDLIIGMDIIKLGDYSLTHRNGKILLSFSVPGVLSLDFQQIVKK